MDNAQLKANPAVWDFRDPYEWMERTAKSEMPPLMISCALTGAIQGKEYNSHLPESIEEQIEATVEAYNEGAVSVHIHVRDSNNVTNGSMNKEDYNRVNSEIRKRCPGMIINNSTGGGPDRTVEEKLLCIFADCKPDMASLNPGPFQMKMSLRERKAPLSNPRELFSFDINIPITYGDVHNSAKLMMEQGVKPEIEVFHTGQYWVINDLIKEGHIEPPYVFQFVFGFQTSFYPTPWNALSVIQEAPKNSIFFYPGIGPYQLPMNMMGMLLGSHVRVGLEDNVYYRRGELSTGAAQQVARIRRIAEEMNRPLATVKQAREMLGLPPA
jgi:3-keto-5-aminohexanoate cleavage enzyme